MSNNVNNEAVNTKTNNPNAKVNKWLSRSALIISVLSLGLNIVNYEHIKSQHELNQARELQEQQALLEGRVNKTIIEKNVDINYHGTLQGFAQMMSQDSGLNVSILDENGVVNNNVNTPLSFASYHTTYRQALMDFAQLSRGVYKVQFFGDKLAFIIPNYNVSTVKKDLK